MVQINIPNLDSETHRREFPLADIILGGQDGLVNVLGVILGVAAASGSLRLVLAAGLAATFAESISMAAVAYTSKLSSADHYESELNREVWEIENKSELEKDEVRQIYRRRGFENPLLDQVVQKITNDRKVWLEVMMAEELGLEPVDRQKVLGSSILVGGSAVIGSLIPLIPFIFLPIALAPWISIFMAALALVVMGAYKAKVTVGKPLRSGLKMGVIGIASAVSGYLVGLAFKV